MLSKNILKHYSTLLNKKFRDKEEKFIVEGMRLVEEGLKSNFECETVIVTENYNKHNAEVIKSLLKEGDVEIVGEVEFKKMTDTKSPQGILGVFKKGNQNFIIEPNAELILAMEDISDPGNVGTIFRNADWFGLKNIILSGECAEVFNPKVLRASMGSVFHIDFLESGNLYDELGRLKQSGYKIAVADMEGVSIYDYTKPKKLVLVVCNEAHGPTKQLLDLADLKLTIPAKGKAESLNVASASAVILNELTK